MGVDVQVEWVLRTRGIGNGPLFGGVQGQCVVSTMRAVLYTIDKKVIVRVTSDVVRVWPRHTERYRCMGRRGRNIRQEGGHGEPWGWKLHRLRSQTGIDTHGEQCVWRRGWGRKLPATSHIDIADGALEICITGLGGDHGRFDQIIHAIPWRQVGIRQHLWWLTGNEPGHPE